jgi:hypothetical protein
MWTQNVTVDFISNRLVKTTIETVEAQPTEVNFSAALTNMTDVCIETTSDQKFIKAIDNGKYVIVDSHGIVLDSGDHKSTLEYLETARKDPTTTTITFCTRLPNH